MYLSKIIGVFVLLSVYIFAIGTITYAGPADGIFGDYFTNIITSDCAPDSIVTGFNSTLGADYGKKDCTPLKSIIGTIFGASMAPDGKAMLGFNSSGAPIYGSVNWQNSAGNIYYTGGNLGIGKTSPSSILEAYSVTMPSVRVKTIGSISNGTQFGFVTGGSKNSEIWNWENGFFRIGTNNTEQLRIESGGNVGIGTSTPGAKLDVNGLIHANGNLTNVLSYANNGTPINGIKIKTNIPYANSIGMPTIRIEGYEYGNGKTIGLLISWYVWSGNFYWSSVISSYGGYTPEVKLANEGGKIIIFINDRTYYGRFTISAYDHSSLGTTPMMFQGWTAVDEIITGNNIYTLPYKNAFAGQVTVTGNQTVSGNMGIGTTTPGSPLEIKSTTDGILRLRQNQAGEVWNYIEYHNDTARQWWTGTDVMGNFQIGKDGPAGTARIENAGLIITGNVGIGTTTPGAKLEVNGDMKVGDIFGGVSGGTRAIWKFNNDWPNYGIFYTEGSTDRISISPNGGGISSPSITINGSNVGIGTNTPTVKLEVNGDIKANNFIGVVRTYPRRADGPDINFNWNGQPGQPPWLWGGSDGKEMYVYNPSNFTVALADNIVVPSGGYKHLGPWGVGRTANGAILVNTAYTADRADTVPWSGIIGLPAFASNNVSGRVRAYELGCEWGWGTSCDANTNGRIDKADYATTAESANAVGGWTRADLTWFPNLSGKPTTLAGYGITDDVVKYNVSGNGNIYGGAFYYTSDRKLKSNIEPLENSLKKIISLNGYSFNWKKDGRKDIGLIAQEVEKIFPELVNTSNTTGTKSVEYGNIIAPMVEAIKEQQTTISKQQIEIDLLRKEIHQIKQQLK